MSKAAVLSLAQTIASTGSNGSLVGTEIARLTLLMRKWGTEPLQFAVAGKTTSQIHKDLNTWLRRFEGLFRGNMAEIDVLSGFGGFAIARNSVNAILGSNIAPTREAFLAIYRSRMEALASVEGTKARGIRNAIAARWKSDEKLMIEAINEFDKQSTALGLTQREKTNQFLNSFIGRQASGIKDGSGRTWRPDTYSAMYSRTRSRELEDEINETEIINNDLDVVQVTNANTTTPICLQYERKIFSLTGKTPELPILQIRPPFHPNCRHRLKAIKYNPEKAQETNQMVDNKAQKITKGERKTIRKQEAWIKTNRPPKAA
jgi:hypothetical protein